MDEAHKTEILNRALYPTKEITVEDLMSLKGCSIERIDVDLYKGNECGHIIIEFTDGRILSFQAEGGHGPVEIGLE